MESNRFGLDLLDRMVRAVEKQRERLARATRALGGAQVPYAVVGDNAVAVWVATVDTSAVRFTPEVVIAVRQENTLIADAAIRGANFQRVQADRLDLFFDEPSPPGTPISRLLRQAVRLASDDKLEQFNDGQIVQMVTNSVELGGVKVASLDELVPAELTANRTLNKVRVRDLIDVGLIDSSWCDRFPSVLADRLRELLADPDG